MTPPLVIDPARALPGREDYAFEVPESHAVLGTPLRGPWPDNSERILFAMGCFWGAERLFWQIPGVIVTAAMYAQGVTPHPTYEEVCTGATGHAEAVLTVFDPTRVTLEDLLKVFWEDHDPTQGMRQGNDIGTQYRSGIYTTSPEQAAGAALSLKRYQQALRKVDFGEITTEIESIEDAYYAEAHHQQYLHKNPSGYCNHGFCQAAY